MNTLTDDECRDIYNLAMEQPDRSAVSVTRAIEQAVIRKLSEGVSVKPVANISASSNGCIGFVKPDKDYYALDQLQTAIAAARVQENERCAKVCDETAETLSSLSIVGATRCGLAIRALIGGTK